MDGCTKSFGFDVLTAPIAQVDRRGLSQAWYSALHLAGSAQPAAQRGTRSTPQPVLATVLQRPASHPGSPQRASTSPVRTRGARSSQIHAETTVERRAPRNALARKIAQAFSQPRRSNGHASFVLDDVGGRVHVTIRTDGSSVRLIAICAPRAGAQVARALDDARYALAKRAMHVDARLRERAR